jgi:hypothetical protein
MRHQDGHDQARPAFSEQGEHTGDAFVDLLARPGAMDALLLRHENKSTGPEFGDEKK